MWFKNILLFKLEQEFTLTPEELHDALASKPFANCLKSQKESMGWISPLGRSEEVLCHAANQYMLITMAHQERILPASVIREELEERVIDIEDRENRKVSNREKKEMRENIEQELLARSFTRTRKIDAYLDPKGQWLAINTSSAKQGEILTKLLRTSLGSIPLAAPEVEDAPTYTMTEWLQKNTLPAPFQLGSECELKSPNEDNSSANFKKHELLSEEVLTNIANGKLVSKLELKWDNKISFVLTEDLQIKKLKFLDVLEENLQDHDPQSHAERLDIEFSLMTGELSQLYVDLFKILSE